METSAGITGGGGGPALWLLFHRDSCLLASPSLCVREQTPPHQDVRATDVLVINPHFYVVSDPETEEASSLALAFAKALIALSPKAIYF